MKKIFGILLLVCSIGTLLWFVPVSITIGEKKVEEKKIGLKGLYLDDDKETVCAKIKELNSLFPDAKYEGNSYQCWISNGPTIMISMSSLDGKVIDISFSTKGLEVLFNNKQYNNVQFLEMIAKELNPMNNIEKLSDGYKSENKELDYAIYLFPSYIDDQVDIFSIQRLSKIQEKLERDEAQREERDLAERQEAERQDAKKVGIKGFYLDSDAEYTCNKLKELGDELKLNASNKFLFKNESLEYYHSANKCMLFKKDSWLTNKIKENPKYLEQDYILVPEIAYISINNGNVNVIKFSEDLMDYLFKTKQFETKEFCQTMLNNVSWLGRDLETILNDYGNVVGCKKSDTILGYRFVYSKVMGFGVEKIPKVSFK